MNVEKYFDDCQIFTEKEISKITAQGIELDNGIIVDFSECAITWAKINSVEKSRCVGKRNVEDLTFTFCTMPKPTKLQFIKKCKLIELFSKPNSYQRFQQLHSAITEYGFKTFDMT